MSLASLQRMIEQIASNMAGESQADDAARVARHLRDFWTPAMLAELGSAVDSGAVALSPLASDGLARALATAS